MLKAETSSKAVTPSQIKFLRMLHDHGPMSVNELTDEMGKSKQYVYETMRALCEAGIIEKTYDGVDTTTTNLSWNYKLSVPLDSINIKQRRIPYKIPDEEILYAAILRNGGMTGRELRAQFRTVFPHRSEKTILASIIPNARHRKWCR